MDYYCIGQIPSLKYSFSRTSPGNLIMTLIPVRTAENGISEAVKEDNTGLFDSESLDKLDETTKVDET